MRDTAAGFGVTFDQWQDGAGRLILAKRADGSYAASIGGVVLSIPRQVGKTFLIGAIVFALCLLNPGLTVLWTAHRLKTANETFGKMQAFARRKKIAPYIAKVVLGSGDEEIQFHNGSRILFGARERGFGRGFDDVDVEVFDEAQILTEVAIDDMVPATNAAKNALVLFMGTPPKPSDPSEVFRGRRDEALSGEDTDTAYIEFSAEPECDPEDREQWARANPSYPGRTSESAMLRMKKLLGPESFLREGLGIWDERIGGPQWEVISEATWTSSFAAAAPEAWRSWLTGPVALAIECPPGLPTPRTSVLVAGERHDGGFGIDVAASGPGVDWVVAEVKAMVADKTRNIGQVVIDPRGPAGSLIADLDAALKSYRVTVTPCATTDLVKATGSLVDEITTGQVKHRNHPDLTRAVSVAAKRKAGESFVIDRWGKQDASELIGAVLARWGLTKVKKPRTTERRALVF